MLLVAADIAVNSEFGRNGTPGKTPCRDRFEPIEQTSDVDLRLNLAPGFASVGINLIQPMTRAILDAESAHALPRAFRSITASALSGRYASS
ncbi:MAG TPA: hypothetical protein VJ226_16215, partial [Bradyrhizobium sp.]|nr:hypothetical protein [Bradyrhizobium sp.]